MRSPRARRSSPPPGPGRPGPPCVSAPGWRSKTLPRSRSCPPWRRCARSTPGSAGTRSRRGRPSGRSTTPGSFSRFSCRRAGRRHELPRASQDLRGRHLPGRGEEHRRVPRVAPVGRRDRGRRLRELRRDAGDRAAVHGQGVQRPVEGLRPAEAGGRGTGHPRRRAQRRLRRAGHPRTGGGDRRDPFRSGDGRRVHRPAPDVRGREGDPALRVVPRSDDPSLRPRPGPLLGGPRPRAGGGFRRNDAAHGPPSPLLLLRDRGDDPKDRPVQRPVRPPDVRTGKAVRDRGPDASAGVRVRKDVPSPPRLSRRGGGTGDLRDHQLARLRQVRQAPGTGETEGHGTGVTSSARPKVAVVVPKYGTLGGGERFVYELTERLARTGRYEIHVIANRWGPGPGPGVFHKIPRVPFPRFPRQALFAWLAGREAEKGRFDLVHAHDRIFRADVFTMHSIPHETWVRDIRKRRPTLFDRGTAWVERRMMEEGRCEWYLPVSSIAGGAYREKYPIDPSRMRVMHPGVDLARFSSPDREACRREVRARYGIGPSEIVILFVGMNFEVKGLDAILRAVARTKALRSDAALRLLVVGRGNEAKYRSLASSLGIGDSVVFAGAHAEGVEAFYLASDLFMMLSAFDTFGMVVLEAMASRLPVIV